MAALPASAQEETSIQFWGSVILGYQESERLYLEVEIQPKAQITGEEWWRNIDATWLAEYYPSKWFDLTGELVTGYTDHTSTVSSFEVTPKVGLRLHLVEQTLKKTALRQKRYIERLPLERFYLATWLRLEYRIFFIPEIRHPVTSGVSGSVLNSRSPSTTQVWAMTGLSLGVRKWYSLCHWAMTRPKGLTTRFDSG